MLNIQNALGAIHHYYYVIVTVQNADKEKIVDVSYYLFIGILWITDFSFFGIIFCFDLFPRDAISNCLTSPVQYVWGLGQSCKN